MLAGNFSELALPGVLQMLGRISATGRLAISTGEEQAHIFFYKGAVRSAYAPSVGRLGELLLKRAHLDEDTLAMVLRYQRDTQLPLGQLLVDLGLLSPEIVGAEIDAQIRRVLAPLVNLRHGEYEFTDLEPSAGGLPTSFASAATLLLHVCGDE